MSKPFDFSQSH